MTRSDKILTVILLIAGLAAYGGLRWFTGQEQGGNVVVKAGSTVAGRQNFLPDGEKKVLTVPGPLGNSIVEVAGGKVHMLDSPCPDKVCVKMGWISRPGQTVVCVPNRVVIGVEGSAADSLDSVTQ